LGYSYDKRFASKKIDLIFFYFCCSSLFFIEKYGLKIHTIVFLEKCISTVSDKRQAPTSMSGHRGTDVEQIILYGNIIKEGTPGMENYKRGAAIYETDGKTVTNQMKSNIKNSFRYKNVNK
jgi:hypothetical protein